MPLERDPLLLPHNGCEGSGGGRARTLCSSSSTFAGNSAQPALCGREVACRDDMRIQMADEEEGARGKGHSSGSGSGSGAQVQIGAASTLSPKARDEIVTEARVGCGKALAKNPDLFCLVLSLGIWTVVVLRVLTLFDRLEEVSLQTPLSPWSASSPEWR